jgi:hypothetical protein
MVVSHKKSYRIDERGGVRSEVARSGFNLTMFCCWDSQALIADVSLFFRNSPAGAGAHGGEH